MTTLGNGGIFSTKMQKKFDRRSNGLSQYFDGSDTQFQTIGRLLWNFRHQIIDAKNTHTHTKNNFIRGGKFSRIKLDDQ